jgi:hypothetical protein
MSICTPQERAALAIPTAETPRSAAGPEPAPRIFKPPEWEWSAFGEIGWWVRKDSGWRDILLGPEGLRLDAWCEEGRVVAIKSGPHRIVYLYQALPRPEPAGDPPPVGPPRQGA